MTAPAWRLRPADARVAGDLAAAAGVLPITARVLAARGVAPEEAPRLVRPQLGDLHPPDGLPDIAAAAARLAAAVASGELVGVFGDYDVDGVTSAAIVASFLRRAGAAVTVRVARREAGYGFSPAEAATLCDAGARAIVTLDCGTSDHEAIAAAIARGCDVIVVDHHRVPRGESAALALVNPHRADGAPAFRGLCSAGLAFYLCAALRARLARADLDLREWLDLVAIGTIADVAPLREANRILVSAGLRRLGRRERPGLRALMEVAGVARSLPTAEDVSFRIAPRLNAPGRLGEARPALDCLLAGEGEARDAASACEDANRERKAVQARVMDQALAQLAAAPPRDAVVVAGQGWHPGVVGIVAGRLARQTGLPAAAIALEGDTGRGSARSVEGFDLHGALSDVSDLFLRFGGHAAACGFSLRAGDVPALREAISAAVRARRGPAPAAPALDLDATVDPEELDAAAIADLWRLSPFGAGWPAPALAGRFEVLSARAVGEDGRHLQMAVRARAGSLRAIGFGLGARAPAPGERVALAFHPDLDEWQGAERARLRIVDLGGELVA